MNPIQLVKDSIAKALIEASERAVRQGRLREPLAPGFEITPCREKAHGDFASNFAMQCAKAQGQAPRAVAQAVLDELDLTGTAVESAEIAGPGFVNFRVGHAYYENVVRLIDELGERYGRTEGGRGQKVMVEFISANPTGPMHMGNARGGAIGDSLASILDACGYDVTREFYVNDAGNQVDNLAKSLEARYLQLYLGEDAVAFPEEGYHGDDVRERAKEYAALHGDSLVDAPSQERREKLVEYGLQKNIENMQRDLGRYKIVFDRWFFESELHKSGYVKDTIDLLERRGHIYEKDGALWFRATDFGLEKDEVMKKSNGFYTYYAVDIAYHRNKFEARGFDRVIDVFGADHHGHTLRFRAGLEALGIDPGRLDFVLMQLVRLIQDGEVVRMSKRTGKAISLNDLLDDIPIDAARFFFNMRQADSQMDFDLDLAVKQSSDNPVYYVQYAHARICSILKNLAAEGIREKPAAEVDLSLLTTAEELDLIRLLGSYPEEIVIAARAYDPSRMTHYAMELSSAFHRFYNACRVKCDDSGLCAARLALCGATRQVLRNVLSLLKISAPELM
ncbi:arginine--tRNA ligase [Feifania hominis]|uniref:Arginine--tRNA ligase n=1 Tax=Feifania hominis TaxID=2763660 RepID=A0A926DEJ4_9FIRM|nr:arginine--tRNA ligase [Feifania hominis]MBC8536668.1 arginine--tRNA ligase [Feifania hominis]